MILEHIHETLQLASVSMKYIIGIALIVRWWELIKGIIFTPSAAIILLLGVHELTVGVKHTWVTEQMLRLSHNPTTPRNIFSHDAGFPIFLDCVLLSVGSAILYLSARPSLGRLAGPTVAAGLIVLIIAGAWITDG